MSPKSSSKDDIGTTLNGAVVRQNTALSWRRPSSLFNIATDIMRRTPVPVLDSVPAVKNRKSSTTPTPPGSPVGPSNERKITRTRSLRDSKTVKNTFVNIVLVEAKGLPDAPGDGLSHGIHCKFRLGSHTYKSKSVTTSRHPQWREQFRLNGNGDYALQISLWDKGRQKNFMGSCVLDLSSREIERTHDIWQNLDEGYGSIHLSVTICTIKNLDLDAPCGALPKEKELHSKYAFYNISSELQIVGELHVKVIGARGLHGKPNAYCTLELDNERVQTPKVCSGTEPVWNKNYVFNVFDVTSALEVTVQDNSLNSLLNDFLGRVSVPLLRIGNGEARWYALKDNSKRRSAKGNCPRIRLEMSVYWNPVIASLKLFRPKQVKYIAKPPKFDLALVYKNVKFIRDTFNFLYRINESFKRFLEWDDRELAYISLFSWLLFWYYFEPWMGPLLLVVLFPICYLYDKRQHGDLLQKSYSTDETVEISGNIEDLQNTETMTDKIKGLPEMTFTITDGIEYMVSVAERFYNLASFKVPFLSCLAIILLIGASGVIYCIPFKYLMIAFGLYKFGRKYVNPDRMLNNDLLDFISRIPDNRLLKDWKELNVPEPQYHRNSTLPVTPTTPSAS